VFAFLFSTWYDGQRPKKWMTPNVIHHRQNPTEFYCVTKIPGRKWTKKTFPTEFQSWFFGFLFMKKFRICIRGLHHVCLALSACNSERTTEEILMTFCEWKTLLKFVHTIQFWFKSDNSNVHFTWRFAFALALIWNSTYHKLSICLGEEYFG
jgi:hypothetical protein